MVSGGGRGYDHGDGGAVVAMTVMGKGDDGMDGTNYPDNTTKIVRYELRGQADIKQRAYRSSKRT